MAKGWRNSAEIDALLKSSEVQEELGRLTQRAATSAGPGFKAETTVGRGRALGMVYPETESALRAERKYHRLMRAQDAMRGDS